MIEAAKVVATGLSEYDPENSETYEKNLEEYVEQLQELHKDSLEKNKFNSKRTKSSCYCS